MVSFEGTRPAVAFLVLLMLVSTAPAIDAGTPKTGSRATDAEPANNDPGTAPVMVSGEVLAGSILFSPANDVVDFYAIQVQNGKELNASLYLNDYDPARPWAHNLQLLVGPIYTWGAEWRDASFSEARWEVVSSIATASEWWFIVVLTNSTSGGAASSEPTNYTLSAMVGNVPIITRGVAASGFLDSYSSRTSAWYRIDPAPVFDEVVSAEIAADETVDVDLSSYLRWEWDLGSLRVLNASWMQGMGQPYHILFAGSEGDVYLRVDAVYGAGDFSLTVSTVQWKGYLDLNNQADWHVNVRDNEPMVDTIDGSMDPVDWYAVDMKAGERISKLSFRILKGDWDLYSLIIFNTTGEPGLIRFNTMNGDWPNDQNPVSGSITLEGLEVQATGTYLFALVPVQAMNQKWGEDYKPPWCNYSLTFTLPNQPPIVTGKLPTITMKEDTVRGGLVLADHFMDPDGQALKYSVSSFPENVAVEVKGANGDVTFTPAPDWFGTEAIVFRATDNGPGSKFVETKCTVIVEPVNDAPSIIYGRFIANITMNESEVSATEPMSTVFKDVDNDPNKPLLYIIAVEKAHLVPADAKFPVPVYNKTTDTVVVGPADLMFGNATITVTADDDNGTEKKDLPMTRFNVTVVHGNHAPTLASGVVDPMEIDLVEDDPEEGTAVVDLWTIFQDKDTGYTGDALVFSFEGEMNVVVNVSEDGTITFDATQNEFFPGQLYQETVYVTATDKAADSANMSFIVTVEPRDDGPSLRSSLPPEDNITIEEGRKQVFKLTVSDPDTLEADLNYTWFLDDVPIDCYMSMHSYFTDFSSADGKVHRLRVEVRDGTSMISRQWDVTIENVNRKPVDVAIASPVNATRFETGDTAGFKAQASDPDSDTLTYTWYMGGKVIGSTSDITADVSDWGDGFHTVTLIVSDGTDEVNTTVTIEVRDKEKARGAPFLGAPALIMAVAAAALALAAGKARRWSR